MPGKLRNQGTKAMVFNTQYQINRTQILDKAAYNHSVLMIFGKASILVSLCHSP